MRFGQAVDRLDGGLDDGGGLVQGVDELLEDAHVDGTVLQKLRELKAGETVCHRHQRLFDQV